MPLFEQVLYHLSESLSEHTRHEISRLLDNNGANKVLIDRATHIISNTIEFEGCDTIGEDVACVTPYWVERSMELGQLLDPKYFSADKDMFFSGIVATSADLPPGDKEVIASGILAQGGAWREGLTRDVTHLFVTNTRSEKYLTAMHFRDSAHITILLPQWFDQCWSTQMRLPPHVFQFPDPPYLNKDHDITSYKAQMLIKGHVAGTSHLGAGIDKQAVFSTVQMADSDKPSLPVAHGRRPWQSHSILLSSSLELDAQRRKSLEDRVEQAGGSIVSPQDEDEISAIERADVFITRFRTGAAYARALSEKKTIGTLAWMFYVERTGVMSRPRDQLLHYPVRDKPIDGFEGHEITVTNYLGDAREYLKKLIDMMGAKFTPTMTGRNTIVIAAYKCGNKTAKAEEWSVPVVTHRWLEDCFIQWRNLTPAQKKYLDYAPGVNYGTVLGDRGVGRVGLEEDPDLPSEPTTTAAPENAPEQRGSGKDNVVQTKESNLAGFTGTATSMREEREVEEVEDVLDLHREDVNPVGPRGGPPLSPTKVGPPRGVKKTAAKKDDGSGDPVTKPGSKTTHTSNVSVVEGKDAQTKSPLTRGTSPNKSGSNHDANKAAGDELGEERSRSGIDGESPPLKENVPMKIGPPVKSKPKPRPDPSTKLATENDDDSVVEVQPPKTPTTKPPSQRTKPKARPPFGRTRVKSISESEQEAAEEGRSGAGKVKRRSLAAQPDTDEEDPRSPKAKSRAKPTVKGKARAPTPVLVSSDDDENHSGLDVTPVAVKSKPLVSGLESGDEIQLVLHNETGKKTSKVTNTGRTKSVPQPSPGRIVSVELADLRSSPLTSPAPKPTTLRPKTLAKPLPRTSSMRASAYEIPISSPKRSRLSTNQGLTSWSPTPSPQPSPGRAERKPDVRKVASTSSGASSPVPPAIQRTSSRRNAAAAATQKLRRDVMPDVLKYETERKRDAKGGPTRRRKSSQYTSRSDENGGDDDISDSGVGARKRRKISIERVYSAKGKGRAIGKSGAQDTEMPNRFITHSKGVKRSADENDEPMTGKAETRGGARKKVRIEKSESDDGFESEDEATPSRSSWDVKKIRVLKTKVELPEHIEKALAKLGLKFTQKPQECTHLVANSLARTEKFLCALPNAPFVLSQGWLMACADSKKIVAERDYVLHDPDMERKHNFKLVEALERARELKRTKQKLLQGHFFYFTPGIPVALDMLKNVLQTLGAEGKEATPTMRNIAGSDTRHVISCLKDKSLWRALAKQGVPIYSHELIIMAAFTQYVDWDGEDKLLSGNN